MTRKQNFSRRRFIASVSLGSIAAISTGTIPFLVKTSNNTSKLAILGGSPVSPNKVFPKWPYVDQAMEDLITKTIRSGVWSRIQDRVSGTVTIFEKDFADLMGAKVCVSTGSGTQALSSVMEAMEIGFGDEVITSPYSDMGTISSILTSRALPVMADLDRESFQLDPDDVEKKINRSTKAIMPVHIMGQPANMERIMAIARKHNLKVIEDACQAHLGEYQGKKLGTIGDAGCFSFQASKTIACGEGGAAIGNNEALMERAYTVMMNGLHNIVGTKYRMNELEGAILLGQLPTVKERHLRRNQNAEYLTRRLAEVPGLVPQKLYPGTDSGSFHLYAMSYKKEHFNNADRSTFLKALAAEGINASGYIANGLHKEPWTDHILNLDVYTKIFSARRLRRYRDELQLPNTDQVCADMVMLAGSGPLTGTRSDMDDIINAIIKVYENRDQLRLI
jgi:perosamine synthetase